ncbi:MAG: hypothetical protein A2428_15040 [Bdellovibrionales bacterium RIFOXYC1_FULL_54_43]|nr:MAG: hypothetical protein A2428_15040 [Bdellovibrionales bacterium RIFOXYC1_FULL_54_43]OFZ82290.1 MAG: hypothetical protein A2603_01225 [Bdellovibrionales bacterium RIFOXYD1_FULL_55_31]
MEEISMKTTILTALVAVSLVAALPVQAQSKAAGGGTSYLAGHLGAGFPNNGQGTNLMFGGAFGFFWTSEYSGAVFIDHMNVGSISSSLLTLNQSSQGITLFGVEANRELSDLVEGLQVGIKVGLTSTSVTATAPGVFTDSQSNMNFFIGPKVAYDYPVVGNLRIGGEGNFLFKSTSDEPITGFATVNGTGTMFNLLGVVKYLF